ncbi:MAG: ParA family protein [Halopseudomonas sp.]
MAGKVIGVQSEKGGVGKTMAVCQIAFELTEQGSKVCVVDNDPQGNATSSFFGDKEDGGWPTAITGEGGDNPVALTEHLYRRESFAPLQVLEGNDSLWLLGPSDDLAVLESESGDAGNSEEHEGELIQGFCDSIDLLCEAFDYIIIDNGPSFNRKFTASLAASESGGVLLPMTPDFDPLRGVKRAISRIERMREIFDIDIPVIGILLNLWETNPVTQVAKSVKADLETEYGELVFKSVLHKAADLQKARGLQEWIGHLAPKSKAAAQITEITNELERRVR